MECGAKEECFLNTQNIDIPFLSKNYEIAEEEKFCCILQLMLALCVDGLGDVW